MKNLYSCFLAFLIVNFAMSIINFLQAQTPNITESERQSLIQQVKKEVLDSLNKTPAKPFGQISDALTVSGYVESYYIYDIGNPKNHTRPAFTYSHNRQNEVSINLGYLKTAFVTEKVRVNVALAVGSYMNANYVAEPGVLKNIYEANAGFKISKKHDLWVDAGIMPSHLGFESAAGKDSWTVTRSLFADNSPYFETGAKISYTNSNGKWFISTWFLNGWQRIQKVEGNTLPAFGHQLTYKPNAKILLNSSSFVGSDKPDSTRQMRYYHNFYGIYQLSEKVGLTTGFDIGLEQKSKGSSQYNAWLTPVILLKVNATDKLSLTGRAEYFGDAHGVIIATGTPNNFKTIGYSVNLDYQIHDNVLWRIEGRGFSSQDEVFVQKNKPSKNNYFFTTALAMSF